MMPSVSIAKRKFLLPCIFILAILLQFVACEKEPHEDSKEDESAEHHGKPTRHSSEEDMSKSDLGFAHAFVAALSVIVVSELGDKTFFIAAIMAMRHSRLVVFSGAILALIVMTILSVLFGWITVLIPRVYTYWISTALFAIFGLKMLKEGYHMSPNEGQEEFEEVQSDLKKQEDEMEKESSQSLKDEEAGDGTTVLPPISWRHRLNAIIPKVFLQALTLTFLAEWGDRSQLATILLAAREDIIGVTLGAVIGHSLCTGLAVLGGRMIAQKISVKTVTLVGGVVFLIFAVSALFMDPES